MAGVGRVKPCSCLSHPVWNDSEPMGFPLQTAPVHLPFLSGCHGSDLGPISPAPGVGVVARESMVDQGVESVFVTFYTILLAGRMAD